MSKLEESEVCAIDGPHCAHLRIEYKQVDVGGGIRCDSWLCKGCGTPFAPQPSSYIDSLTAERDALKKRVEELERRREDHGNDVTILLTKLNAQLQAAREPAEPCQ